MILGASLVSQLFWQDQAKLFAELRSTLCPACGAVHASLTHSRMGCLLLLLLSLQVADSPFARCSYTEGIELLQKAISEGHKFEDMVGAGRGSAASLPLCL